MNRRIQPAGLWWSSRSVREQRLLAVMGALILVVLIWLVIVRPAWGWREHAADRRAVAEARLQVIETRLAGAVTTDRPAMALADVEQAARAAAEAANLEVVLSVAETGRIAFVARGVTSPVLFGWLTALNDDYGVSIQDLSVIENADATLEAVGEIGGR